MYSLNNGEFQLNHSLLVVSHLNSIYIPLSIKPIKPENHCPVFPSSGADPEPRLHACFQVFHADTHLIGQLRHRDATTTGLFGMRGIGINDMTYFSMFL